MSRADKITAVVLGLLMSLACGMWVKAVYDYHHTIDELAKDPRNATLILESLDRLDPPKVIKIETNQKYKEDIIDDVIEMKMIGAL